MFRQEKPVRSEAHKRGFTLIEILIVIGIIAILAAIVIIAINPARQFAQARDTQRESHLNTILNALGQNIADNKGVLGGDCEDLDIDSSADRIGEDKLDLSCLVPTYIPTTIPFDPKGGSEDDTLYTIEVENGRYKVCTTVDEPAIPRTEELCVTR